MNNEITYTKDSLNATHEIKHTLNEMNEIIYSLKTLGIPAGEKLEDIQAHLYTLAEECSGHLMKEQHEHLQSTQDQTWNLVGMVFEDAVNKMKV